MKIVKPRVTDFSHHCSECSHNWAINNHQHLSILYVHVYWWEHWWLNPGPATIAHTTELHVYINNHQHLSIEPRVTDFSHHCSHHWAINNHQDLSIEPRVTDFSHHCSHHWAINNHQDLSILYVYWWEHWWLKSVALGLIPSDYQHFSLHLPLSALWLTIRIYFLCEARLVKDNYYFWTYPESHY